MNSELNSKNIQTFLDILLNRRAREYVLQKYGEKGFDIFTGYLDWEFLDLYEIVEQELQYLETARKILSEEAPEGLLKTYDLDTNDDYFEKIELVTDNLRKKIDSRNIIQKYPEIEIMFSLTADVYLKHFNEERREFFNQNQENSVRKLLRTLVDFYSYLKQREDVVDEENVLGRKLIVLISMLDEITLCFNLGDVLTEEEDIECKHIVNERIIRATMLDEIYRKKREQQINKDKLRNLCREIIADLEKALYLQWVLNYNEVEPILKTLLGKMKLFMKEGVNLPYEKIIKDLKETFEPIYLRNKEVEDEKRGEFLEKISEVEEYLESNKR